MIELKGKYNTAKVFTDKIEESAKEQIIQLLNQDFIMSAKVRIMPDCHAGAGCVIGFTADLGDKVIPNLVGVDIGCGVLTIELKQTDIDFQQLDSIIHEYIPAGFNVHEDKIVKFSQLQNLHCYRHLKDTKRIERSIGTLGGGNHFIEVNADELNNKYLVIHSGSRNLGKQVADYYQNTAIDLCSSKEEYFIKNKEIIEKYKKQGRKKEIQKALEDLKKQYDKLQPNYPRELCYLTGEYRNKYLHDMEICQNFAELNREVIANIILDKMFAKSITEFSYFHTVHNYINFKDNVIRKGAISAYDEEKMIIPINMRDGSILAVGKGNPDWNYSAPHGAGRLMSRNDAKKNIKIEEFERSMNGIFSTSVGKDTIDESPMAYKPISSILDNVDDTLSVIRIIKPVYNFKAKD